MTISGNVTADSWLSSAIAKNSGASSFDALLSRSLRMKHSNAASMNTALIGSGIAVGHTTACA